jgi:hypothetical protein
MEHDLFEVRILVLASDPDPAVAQSIVEGLYDNFSVFKNYPLNRFSLTRYSASSVDEAFGKAKSLLLSPEEVSAPKNCPFLPDCPRHPESSNEERSCPMMCRQI